MEKERKLDAGGSTPRSKAAEANHQSNGSALQNLLLPRGDEVDSWTGAQDPWAELLLQPCYPINQMEKASFQSARTEAHASRWESNHPVDGWAWPTHIPDP
jgi:hypothetical protein